MPGLEDSIPLVEDPSLLGCCKPLRIKAILHGVMVTALFSVIMFAYLYLYLYGVQHISGSNKKLGDNSYALASLIIQIISYLALNCLYICNSSGWLEKFISVGYLVLLVCVFLISSSGLKSRHNFYYRHDDLVFSYRHVELVSWANMVAISSYCVWKFSFIILHCCRLKKLVRTILHGATVTILLAVIISAYCLYLSNRYQYDGYYNLEPSEHYAIVKVWLLIQLVAYNAVGLLYICNSSGRKGKFISAGFLVLVLFVFLLFSFAKTRIQLRTDLIFGANIVAMSSYCIWKLYPWIRAIGRWLAGCS